MTFQKIRALSAAILLGLGLVALLLALAAVPALAQPTAPGRPGGPKGPTPTPTTKAPPGNGGPAFQAPAGLAVVDFGPSSYTARGAHAGETVTFTLVANNKGDADALAAEVHAAIPANASYVAASAHATKGAVSVIGKALSWTGVISTQTAITITYRATLPGAAGVPVTATASVYDPGAAAVQLLGLQMTTQAPSGGPDGLGYTYRDSLAPSNPVAFSWVPTTTPASKLDFGSVQADDSVTGPVDIGFTFHFYTGTYTQTSINTNGMVMFGSANLDNTDNGPRAIPNPDPDGSHNFASCFFADLYENDGTQGVWVEHYGAQPNRTTVITFRTAYFQFSTVQPGLFQMILSEGSDQIKCQYAQTAGPPIASGVGAIGLMNLDGRAGLQYAFSQDDFYSNLRALGPLEDRLAIVFTRDAAPRPVYYTSGLETTFSVHPADVASYRVSIRNTGAANGTATTLNNPIPAGLGLVPASAQAQGGGALTANGSGVHWTGVVTAGKSVTITFQLKLPTTLGLVFTDTAVISDPHASLAPVLSNPYHMRVLPPTSGGPDTFGYTFKDSFAPSNPVTFSWIVTTNPGSKLNFNNAISPDDVLTGPVPIGFNFTFYGHAYTQTFISTNGLVSFDSGSASLDNQPIPDPGLISNYATCLWMDLLENDHSQGVWVEQHGLSPNRTLVITYRTAFFADQFAPPAVFQMILFEGSNQIKCQYLNMGPSIFSTGGPQGTVGVVNADGSAGLQYFYTPENELLSQVFVGPLEGNLALLFKPGPASLASLSASVKTMSPQVHAGEQVTYTMVAANDGNATANPATLDDPIPAGASYVGGSAQVQGGGALSANASAVHWTGSLAAGQSVTVTFAVRLPAAGPVTNTVTLSAPQALQPVVRSVSTYVQPATGLGVGRPSYAWADSYAPGISFSWVPTTGASTHQTLTVFGDTDNGFIYVPLGFDFPFFDRVYSNTFVSTNGLVMFNGNGSPLPDSQSIPTPGSVDNYATCFWADQKMVNTPSSGFWYQTDGAHPNQRAVITFILSDGLTATAPYQYQMILFEDGRLKCQYLDMSGSVNGNGKHAGIGLEGRHGDSGVQYFWQPESQQMPVGPAENGLAIQFAQLKNLFLPVLHK